MSNVLGTLTPIRRIADAAHAAGALVLVDGAQFTPHLATDVAAMGCDFYGFTGHKLLGPTGIGVLWARAELLDAMPAFLGGGEMIRDVRLDGWTPNDIPWKFEAGTPPIAEAIGLGRRHRLPRRARHGRRARARGVAHRVRAPHPHRPVRRHHHACTARPSPPSGAGCCRSPSATSTRTTSPRCSTSGACACGPATTAPSRSCGGSAWEPPLGRRCTCTTTPTTSTRWPTPSAKRQSSSPSRHPESHDARSRRPVPRDHPRPLPQPPEPGRARRAARPPGRGVQPPVRRRDHRLPRRRRRRHHLGHPHHRPGLFDQPVVRVDDVGRGEGQERRRGPGRHPGLQGDDVDPRVLARRRGGRRSRTASTPR